MIETNGLILQCEAIDIMNELKQQLNGKGIMLLKDIKPGNRNVQFTCTQHGGGMERKPSAGISTEPVYRGGKLIPAGTVHCFTCGYNAELPEFVSHCFGKQDGGIYGTSWLRRNFGSVEVTSRQMLDLHMSRNRADTSAPTYVTEAELDSYAYTHPYMYKRGLTDEIIDLFDIGYDHSRKCITMPVRDLDGNVPFVQTRSVVGKFHHYEANVRKTDCVYGLYECLQYYPDAKDIKICESILNALSYWCVGIPAVALMGVGGGNQYKLLNEAPYRVYCACLDPDKAGYAATNRLIRNLKHKLVKICEYPDSRDINDLYIQGYNLGNLKYKIF